MPDVKWIKLTTDMFDDEKIRIIESMPDADALLVIWVKMVCQAGKCNNGGLIHLTETMPYSDEMLATIFARPLNTVRLALKTFTGLGMIEVDQRGMIYLLNFEKHQNMESLESIREHARLRQQKHRLALKEGSNADVTKLSRDVTALERERERDIEEEKEEENIYLLNFNNITLKIPLNKLNGDIKIQNGQLYIFYQTLSNSLLIAQGKRESLPSARKQHKDALSKLGIDWQNINVEGN